MTGSADSIERQTEKEQAANYGSRFIGSADRMEQQFWHNSFMSDKGAQVQLSEDGCAPALLARLFLGSNPIAARPTSSRLMFGDRVEINGVELYLTAADRAELDSSHFETYEDRVEAYLQMGLKNALTDASNVEDGGVTGAGTRAVLVGLGLDNRLRTNSFSPGNLVAYGEENEKHLMMVTQVEGDVVTLRDGYGREVTLPAEEMVEFTRRSLDDRYGFDNALARTGTISSRRPAPRPRLPAPRTPIPAEQPPLQTQPSSAANPTPQPQPVAEAPQPEPAPQPQPVAEAPQPEPAPQPQPVAEVPQPEPAPQPQPVAEVEVPQPEPAPQPQPVAEVEAPQPEPAPQPQPVAEVEAPQPESAPQPVAEAPQPEPAPQPVAEVEVPQPEPAPQPEPVAVAGAQDSDML